MGKRFQRITPFLCFNNQAEEAVRFYTSIFSNSRISRIVLCGDAGPGPKGSVMAMTFELDGQQFVALNGGPRFQFTEAVSFVVNCQDQQELDTYWEKVSEGGRKMECGWVTDKFGLSWQIVPAVLDQMLLDPDETKAQKVMNAMLGMKKLDIAGLEAAYRS